MKILFLRYTMITVDPEPHRQGEFHVKDILPRHYGGWGLIQP